MPVHIYNSQHTEAIIERYKEQVQGDLEIFGVELGGKREREMGKRRGKGTRKYSQLIYF